MNEEINKGIDFIRSKDPILAPFIEEAGELEWQSADEYFFTLVRKIVSQQLSVKAAHTIFTRLCQRVEYKFHYEVLEPIPQEEYRALGLSRQKYSYIMDLCRHYREEPDAFNHLEDQTDEEAIRLLTSVKGIGLWTAQMFLMFNLGRLNIFAPDDVGLRNAMIKLYGLEEPKKKELAAFAERWAPYKTIACRYLWYSLDNEPK